jgi:RHS repeat-associated protein
VPSVHFKGLSDPAAGEPRREVRNDCHAAEWCDTIHCGGSPFGGLPGLSGRTPCGRRTGLGSTSVVLNGDGTVHSEARYYPYGAVRWSSGTLPTDYRFTGQREDGYIKLTVMGARWYDGQLGRWISPDSIIPDPANPQSLNRLMYVNNNPLKLVDWGGHAGTTAKLIRGASGTHLAGSASPNQGSLLKGLLVTSTGLSVAHEAMSGEILPLPRYYGPMTPTEPDEQWRKDWAYRASKVAMSSDTIALYISLTEAAVADASTLVGIIGGGAGAIPAKLASEAAVQGSPIAAAENFLGLVSLVSAGAGDALLGNTRAYPMNNRIVLGQDTTVSLLNSAGGYVPESNVDFLISAEQWIYDVARAVGLPLYAELHLGTDQSGEFFWYVQILQLQSDEQEQ